MSTNPEYILAGVLMKQHLAERDTSGAFSLFENRSTGASRTPIHVHAHDDETLYLIEGEMQALIAGQVQRVQAGQAVFLPRGVPHQLSNTSGLPAHYLLICTPSGFEGFLAEGGRRRGPGEEPLPPSLEEIERMKTAAPKFGITLLADWPS